MPAPEHSPKAPAGHPLLTRPWLSGVLVALLALGARAVYFQQVRGLLLFQEPTGDAAHYLDLARRIAADGFWAPRGEAYFQAPLYPWYLASLGGEPGLLLARVLQWIGGALGALLAFDTARRIGGPVAGLVGGILAALYAPRLFFEGELLSIAWCLLAFQLALWLLVLPGSGRGASGRAAAAGVAMAVAALAQPNTLLAGIFLLGGLLLAAWRGPLEARAGARGMVPAFALGLALPLLPVLLRNHRESGDWVLISANAGVNFFIGNNPAADGSFHLPPEIPLRNDTAGLVAASTEAAARALGGRPGPAAVSGYWFDRGLAFWGSEPLRAVGLTARKLLYFVNDTELPNHYAIDFLRERVPILRVLPGFALLATFGLWGLWRQLRAPEARLLWLSGAGYALSVILFFVTDRYRLPIVAVLFPAAGLGAADLLRITRARRPREAAFAGATLLALLALAFVPLVDVRPATAHMHNLLGAIHYRKGDTALAAREFEAALALIPAQSEALNNLGRIRLLEGNPAEAERLFRGALDGNPRLPEAWFNLEELKRNQSRWEEVLTLLDGLEASVPGARQTFGATLDYRRGLARQAQGDTADARRLLTRAVEQKPDLAAAWAALAGIDRAAGRLTAARTGFEKAASLSPDYWGHAYNLGTVLEPLGDHAGAEVAYTRAARLAPQLPEPAYRAAVMQWALGRKEMAVSTFRALADRNYPPAFYQLGRHAESLGQRDAALQSYRRAARAGGPQEEIRLAAGRLAALEGKP